MMKTGDQRPGVCVGIGIEEILAPFAEALNLLPSDPTLLAALPGAKGSTGGVEAYCRSTSTPPSDRTDINLGCQPAEEWNQDRSPPPCASLLLRLSMPHYCLLVSGRGDQAICSPPKRQLGFI